MYSEYPYYGFKNENERTPVTSPKQHQSVQSGIKSIMNPLPIFENPDYIASNKLKSKVIILSGGNSRIGRATTE